MPGNAELVQRIAERARRHFLQLLESLIHLLVRVIRLFAIENAHQSGEVHAGLLTKVIGPRIIDVVLGNRVGNRAELLTRRLGENLHLAGALEEIQVVEAARHRLARYDYSVIRVE